MTSSKVLEIVDIIFQNLAVEPFESKIVENEKEVTIFVLVEQADMGRVIGKNGKTANSIRSVIKAITSDKNEKFYLKINRKDA